MAERIEILTVLPDANPDIEDANAILQPFLDAGKVTSIEAGSAAMGGEGLTVSVLESARHEVVLALLVGGQFKIVEGGSR